MNTTEYSTWENFEELQYSVLITPDTTHFTRFILTRSLRITQIETDECIHTAHSI